MMMLLPSLPLVLLSSILPSSLADAPFSPHIVPLSYDLLVKLPVKGFDGFHSSLVLFFNLTTSSHNITLHATDLHSFRNISLISSSDLKEPLLKTTKIHKDLVEFVFEQLLNPGQYLLTVGEYSGRTNNGSYGVFARRNDGVWTTHLQPNHARRLLPCIDHPSVKATFRISVIHRTDTVALSNTIVTDVHIEDKDWQRTIFSATPRLPAYLIAFSIMPDTQVQFSRQTSFGVTVRVNGAHRSTTLRVVDCALGAFEYLASIITVPLPLNKIDFLLVPEYEGGMENWGHVALSEDIAKNADDAHLIYIVAHEIAHHWIGNKVTVDSWQFICLQEDLADWLAINTLKALLVNEDAIGRFRLAQYAEIIMAEDFLSPGHSLMMPEDIDHYMISTHCYLKGVVMLDSLSSVVGEKFFLSILNDLVATKSFFNVTTFAAYFDQFKVDNDTTLGEIYTYWYTQGGFPSILIENNGPTTRLQQLQKPLWPLRLMSTNASSEFVFDETLVFASEQAPLLFNLNFTSFVRVNYDQKTWSSIFSYMNNDPHLFSAIGRAQLVSDFCYFHANGLVQNGTSLKESVMDMVYTQPEQYELCDWNLYWCHTTIDDTPLLSHMARRLAIGFSTIFDTSDAYGCRNGHAVRTINNFCSSLFGVKCL